MPESLFEDPFEVSNKSLNESLLSLGVIFGLNSSSDYSMMKEFSSSLLLKKLSKLSFSKFNSLAKVLLRLNVLNLDYFLV